MNPVIKHIYLTVLIGGVLLVGVGQMIVIIRAANGRSSGDGFYRTTSQERDRIRARADDAPPERDLNAELAAEDGNAVEPGADDHAVEPDPIPAHRERSVAVSGFDSTRIISQPSETIDVTVSGSRNSVTIKSGTQLHKLGVAGTSNTVTFENETKVSRIMVSGIDNVIVIPEGVEFRITDSGIRTQITRSNATGIQQTTPGQEAKGSL